MPNAQISNILGITFILFLFSLYCHFVNSYLTINIAITSLFYIFDIHYVKYSFAAAVIICSLYNIFVYLCAPARITYFLLIFLLALIYVANIGLYKVLGRGISWFDIEYGMVAFGTAYTGKYNSFEAFESFWIPFLFYITPLCIFSCVMVFNKKFWLQKNLSRTPFPIVKPFRLLLSISIFGFVILSSFYTLGGNSADFQKGWANRGPILGLINTFGAVPHFPESQEDATSLAIQSLKNLDSESGQRHTKRQVDHVIILQMESTFCPNDIQNLSLSEINSDYNYATIYFCNQERSDNVRRFGVNIFGGNSWVSAIESLTGINLPWIGLAGTYANYSVTPYIDLSLFNVFRDAGFSTEVIYPVQTDRYNAETSYSNLGSESVVSVEDFDFNIPHDGRISDQTVFQSILRRINNAENNNFIFAQTNQNHAPYHSSNMSEGEYFLEKLNLSGKYMSDFISELEKIQDNVIFIAYGDHKPSAGFKYKDGTEYQTFIGIWANFQIETPPAFSRSDVWSSVFVPGLACALIVCEPPLYRLNFLAAESCGGNVKECTSDAHSFYRGAALHNFNSNQ